jgi:VanZ family protein
MEDKKLRNIPTLRDFIVYWLAPLVWMGFIFPTNRFLNTNSTSHIIVPILKWLLPHADPATIDLLHIGIRKFVHFFNYAFLTFLLYRALHGRKKILRPEWVLCAGLTAIGYGAIDEYVQTFIPARTGSVYDWLIDSAGVIFVCGIVFVGKNGLRDKG